MTPGCLPSLFSWTTRIIRVPFRFTGKLDRLTVKLDLPNIAEEKLLQQKAQETKNKAQ